MASALVTISELYKENKASAAVSPVSLTANTAVVIPVVGRSMIIAVTPSAADGTVTITKGNGVAAMNDISYSIAESGKVYFIQLDTSSFEYLGNADGTGDANGDKNYIKLTSTKAGSLVACNVL